MPYSDPEQRRAYGREWMRRNPEKARAGMQRWRAAHPDKHRAEGRERYARHKDRLKVQIAAYHRANPDVVRAKREKHRALRIGAEGFFTVEEWLALVTDYEHACAYCGAIGPLEQDHRVPLGRGGTNWIANILPACRVCNARKHLRTEDEFRARLAAEREAERRRADSRAT
jgi:5-methylcytosine-specific restriction endonuclease McrA